MQHPLAETSGAATNGKTNGLITELQYSVWQQKGTTTLANDGPEFTADKRLPFVWGRKGPALRGTHSVHCRPENVNLGRRRAKTNTPSFFLCLSSPEFPSIALISEPMNGRLSFNLVVLSSDGRSIFQAISKRSGNHHPPFPTLTERPPNRIFKICVDDEHSSVGCIQAATIPGVSLVQLSTTYSHMIFHNSNSSALVYSQMNSAALARKDLCNVKIVVSFEKCNHKNAFSGWNRIYNSKDPLYKYKTMNLKDRYRPNPRHHDKIYSSATRTRGKRGAFVTARRFALSCARETT
ncbi:hypothetical protein CDAR_378821 [Caerostris darwini]|uniref:Uncharacterized protein n=1 Tax=Caerostris darwini TaxID=1538125 RepID=A0AAV4TYZ0_9ARAC|nr:hypothetical protein CDAR_378821 [Caerostris darwini]